MIAQLLFITGIACQWEPVERQPDHFGLIIGIFLTLSLLGVACRLASTCNCYEESDGLPIQTNGANPILPVFHGPVEVDTPIMTQTQMPLYQAQTADQYSCPPPAYTCETAITFNPYDTAPATSNDSNTVYSPTMP